MYRWRRRDGLRQQCGEYVDRAALASNDRQRGGRSSLASQPTASVCMGSTATLILSVRSQVEHSNVRSSKPRVPGEVRAKAILCLHVGHIGRSLIKLPITVPQDHRKTELTVLYLSRTGRLFQARSRSRGTGRREPVDPAAAMKCVAARLRPKPPKAPQAGLRTFAGEGLAAGAAAPRGLP